MAGMCWHVSFLQSARATLEIVFRYKRRQINREDLPYLFILTTGDGKGTDGDEAPKLFDGL
jgi:hypothetical protein